MNIDRKTVFLMALFVSSIFVLLSKLMIPTTIQLIVEGQSTYVQQIPNIYTITDMIIVAISACIIGISVTHLISMKPVSRGEDVQSDQSLIAEPADNLTTQEISATASQNNAEDVLRILKGNEQIVIKELLDGGEMNQAELAVRIGISKSTLSRTLYDLESRKLIIRYRNGVSKMVKLADSLRKDQ